MQMDIPPPPYVGLYGSHSGDWRNGAIELLDDARIAYYDPTDLAWRRITASNGDLLQSEVDALVAKQHVGMSSSACVIFHLARTRKGETSETEVTTAVAARCELGFLTGRGIRSFSTSNLTSKAEIISGLRSLPTPT